MSDLSLGIGLQINWDEAAKSWAEKSKAFSENNKIQVKLDFSSGELDRLTKALERLSDINAKRASMSKSAAVAEREAQLISQKTATEAVRTINTQNIGLRAQEKHAVQLAAAKNRLQKTEIALNKARVTNTSTIQYQNKALISQGIALNGLKQFAGQYISLLGAWRVFDNIRQTTADFDRQRVALGALIQDARAAEKIFSQTLQLSIESPFTAQDLIRDTKQLAAYRIETDKLHSTIKQLADVAAGTGAEMSRLILAFGQVRAASVLRGQEIRQFTEAGIPLVAELAAQFSQLRGEVVSVGEVFDLVSARQVPFEMVAKVFEDMTARGGVFYDMQRIQAETLWGIYQKLGDNIQQAFYRIGESQMGVLKGTGEFLIEMVRNLDTVLNSALQLIGVFGVYRLTMKAMSDTAFGSLKNQEKELAVRKAQQAVVLKQAAAYRTLTAAEKESIALSNRGTAADYAAMYAAGQLADEEIKLAVALGRLNKEKAKAILLSKRYNEEQLASMLSSGQMSMEEVAIYHQQNTEIAKQVDGIKNVSRGTIVWTGAMGKLNNAFKTLWSTLRANWIFLLIGAITQLVTWLASAGKAARELQKDLSGIASSGIREADELDRRFRRLAETITNTSENTKEHRDALAELGRTYKDILPSYMLTNKYLTEMKGRYEGVTDAIRDYIRIKAQEEGAAKISESTEEAITKEQDRIEKRIKRLMSDLNGMDLSIPEIGLIMADARRSIAQGVEPIAALQAAIEDITNKPADNLIYFLRESIPGAINRWSKAINDGERLTNQFYDTLSASNLPIGEFRQGFNDLIDEIEQITSEERPAAVGLFTWDERQDARILEKYKQFLAGIPQTAGIDFDQLVFNTDSIKGLPETLRKVIDEIRKDLTDRLGDSTTQRIEAVFKQIAKTTGVSLDSVSAYMKDNSQSTSEWVKTIKSSADEAVEAFASAQYQMEQFRRLLSHGGKGVLVAPFTDEQMSRMEEQARFLTELSKIFNAPSTGGSKASDTRLQTLKEELKVIQDAYKRYQELQKLMSDSAAQEKIKQDWSGIFASFTQLKGQQPVFNTGGITAAIEEAISKPFVDPKTKLELRADKIEIRDDEWAAEIQKQLDLIAKKISLQSILDSGMKGLNTDLIAGIMELGISEALMLEGEAQIDFTQPIEDLVKQIEVIGPKLNDATRKMLDDYIKYLRDSRRQEFNDWNAYMREYGTQAEKEMAIRGEYAQKIEEATTAGAKLSLAREMQDALNETRRDTIEQTELWTSMFQDAERVTTNYVRDMIAKIRALMAAIRGEGPIPIGFSEADIRALAADTEMLNRLGKEMEQWNDELDKRNPFTRMTDGIKSLIKARQKLAKTSDGSEDNTKALNEQYAATKLLVEGFSDVADMIGRVGDALSGLGSDELSKVGDSLSNIASMAMTGFELGGGPIGAVVGGLVGLISEIGKGQELSAESIYQYESYIAATERLIQKQEELLAAMAGSEAVKASEEALAAIDRNILATRQMAKDYLNSGGGLLSEDKGKKIIRELRFNNWGSWGDVEVDTKAQEELARIGVSIDELGKKANGLFDLSEEQLRGLRESEYIWSQLDSETQKYIDSIIEATDEANRLKQVLNEALTGTSFDSLLGEVMNLVGQVDLAFADIEDLFNEHMRNAILKTVQDEFIRGRLESWYQQLAAAMKDDSLSEQERKDLQFVYKQIVEGGKEMLNAASELAGMPIAPAETNLTGISKAVGQMTEDTALTLAAVANSMLYYQIGMYNFMVRWDAIIMGEQVEGAIPIMSEYQTQALAVMNAIKLDTAGILTATVRTADALTSVISANGTRATFGISIN